VLLQCTPPLHSRDWGLPLSTEHRELDRGQGVYETPAEKDDPAAKGAANSTSFSHLAFAESPTSMTTHELQRNSAETSKPASAILV